MNIRPATPADNDFIIAANQAIDQTNNVQKPSKLTADVLQRDLFSTNPKAYAIIAEDDHGKPIGVALYSSIYFASTGPGLWISNLYVSDIARRKGVAAQLVEYLKTENPDYVGVFWATYKINDNMFSFADSIQAKTYHDLVMFGKMSNT